MSFMQSIAAPEWLHNLIVDGIIGGVGTVLGFVPQIMLLFFFLAVLEDSGYMARVAFIMDRIFRRFGLSGKILYSYPYWLWMRGTCRYGIPHH